MFGEVFSNSENLQTCWYLVTTCIWYGNFQNTEQYLVLCETSYILYTLFSIPFAEQVQQCHLSLKYIKPGNLFFQHKWPTKGWCLHRKLPAPNQVPCDGKLKSVWVALVPQEVRKRKVFRIVKSKVWKKNFLAAAMPVIVSGDSTILLSLSAYPMFVVLLRVLAL